MPFPRRSGKPHAKQFVPDTSSITGELKSNSTVAQYSATVAGLAVTAATSIKYQSNFDDVLAMLRPHIANRRK